MALGTTNVSVTAVKNALGVASNDIGTLCTSSKINKWAKGKPVRYNKNAGLVDSERKYANQGFDTNTFTGVTGELFSYVSAGTEWQYLKPRGGSYSEPYRLGDFRGYNHTAEPCFIFKSGHVANEIPSSTVPVSAQHWIEKNPSADISLSDIAFFDNYLSGGYYWIIARNGTTYIKSTPKLISSVTGNDIYIDITYPSFGTWTNIFCVGYNDESDIEARTDFAIMPGGTWQTTISKITQHILVTFVSPTDPGFSCDSEFLHLGAFGQTNSVTMTVNSGYFDSNGNAQSVTYSVMRFVLDIIAYNQGGDEAGHVTVETIGDYDDFAYSGKDTKTWNGFVDFPGSISLAEYFDDPDNIVKFEIHPGVYTISGPAVASLSNAIAMTWTVYK